MPFQVAVAFKIFIIEEYLEYMTYSMFCPLVRLFRSKYS